ncbi:tyrosine protein kinase [Hypoxylon trugodes]|uniref:tyrosine protein kinase n=1 Tax=Hypoxylon trugodes TaxID=326681 RepID=UPI002193C73A|nr:tyrosine protein kinase [Hypoxylon trugodes]KAI1390074.1 tyrosine protein kinase [Hypoxylon trugodes]
MAAEQEAPHDPPLPPILTYPSSTPPTLITQGAEARLYKTTYLLPSLPCALKYRPPKAWRHPILDARLTRHRILAEARVLARCRRDDVPVPAVYAVDESAGWLAMEWVGGVPVRVAINEWLARRRRGELEENENKEGEVEGDAPPVTGDKEEDKDLIALMRRIGAAVGRMHKTGIVHGDLTTSNMMLRPWEKGSAPSNGHAGSGDGLLDGDIVIIDFGLASQSTSDEDRAVDLYVLERAFASTHSRAEKLFSATLESSYREAFKQANIVLKKLEEVRMRGRKRSMIG